MPCFSCLCLYACTAEQISTIKLCLIIHFIYNTLSTSDLILFYFRVEVTFLSLTSFPTVMFVEILLVSSNNAHDALVVESSSTFIGHCHYHPHLEICHDVVSWLYNFITEQSE